jgi:hypothetical protein
MFEESISHGRGMISRLEAESLLSPAEAEELPPHERVPLKEAVAWEMTIEERLRADFGPETLARYETIKEIFTDEISRDVGDATSRAISRFARIVGLLEELDGRAPPRAAPPGAARPSAPPARVEPGPASEDERMFDVFISRAWEDKESVARPLYSGPVQKGSASGSTRPPSCSATASGGRSTRVSPGAASASSSSAARSS